MKTNKKYFLLILTGFLLFSGCFDSNDSFSITSFSDSHGTVIPNKSKAKEGEMITLTITRSQGWQVRGLDVILAGTQESVTIRGRGNTREFIMPASDVVIIGSFLTDIDALNLDIASIGDDHTWEEIALINDDIKAALEDEADKTIIGLAMDDLKLAIEKKIATEDISSWVADGQLASYPIDTEQGEQGDFTHLYFVKSKIEGSSLIFDQKKIPEGWFTDFARVEENHMTETEIYYVIGNETNQRHAFQKIRLVPVADFKITFMAGLKNCGIGLLEYHGDAHGTNNKMARFYENGTAICGTMEDTYFYFIELEDDENGDDFDTPEAIRFSVYSDAEHANFPLLSWTASPGLTTVNILFDGNTAIDIDGTSGKPFKALKCPETIKSDHYEIRVFK